MKVLCFTRLVKIIIIFKKHFSYELINCCGSCFAKYIFIFLKTFNLSDKDSKVGLLCTVNATVPSVVM